MSDVKNISYLTNTEHYIQVSLSEFEEKAQGKNVEFGPRTKVDKANNHLYLDLSDLERYLEYLEGPLQGEGAEEERANAFLRGTAVIMRRSVPFIHEAPTYSVEKVVQKTTRKQKNQSADNVR